MKLKPLAITIVALAALAVAAYHFSRLHAPPKEDARIDQPLIDRSVADKAAQIRITDKEGHTVLLAKNPDATWRVANYYDFPVDFGRLTRLFGDMANGDIKRFVTADPERFSRLDFNIKLELLDSAGKALWSLTFGKEAEGGGTFMHFDDEPKAYLAGIESWIGTNSKEWTDFDLMHLKREDIAKFEIGFKDSPPLVLTRAKKEEPFSAPTPAGKQVDNNKVSSLLIQFTDFIYMNTYDLNDPAAVATKKDAREVKLTTFDGKVYDILIAKKPDETSAKPPAPTPALKTAETKPAEETPGAPEPQPGEEPTPPAPEPIIYAWVKCSDPAARINALMSKRTFTVNQYTWNIMPQKPADLFVDVPPSVGSSSSGATTP